MRPASQETSQPIRFGDALVPTQEWAAAWEDQFPARFADYVAAYRGRVAAYWPELAAAYPEAFRLRAPVEVVAIGTLAAVWVFARLSGTGQDVVRATGFWEHPELDTWGMQAAPTEHQVRRIVEVALSGDESYRLVYRSEVAGRISSLDSPLWLPGQLWLDLLNTADEDAELAEALMRYIDRPALETARRRLEALHGEPNARKRGKEFETVVVQIFDAHGSEVELGRVGDGEQVDVFILRPFFALLECRWRKRPVEPRDISDLIVKLGHRPPLVAGLYVSMTGFTRGARNLAARSADRTVVLVDSGDLETLLSGEVSLEAWWHHRVSELVKRYPDRLDA